MSEARLVSPLLDGFVLGKSISNHNGVRCFPAMRNNSDERYIVKTISIPASQVQLDALLLTGAYPNAEAAKEYFKVLAKGIRSEIQVLDKLAAQRGFLPYLNHQIVQMKDAVGYEIYLLSPYRLTLERHMRHKPLTHLSAVNMGIDLCAALTICRDNGYLYVDLKPGNIILSGNQTYHIADLGFMALSSLKYTPLPERCHSEYTAPEIVDAFSTLNTTLDTYALGLILYQVFNNGQLPPRTAAGEQILPPEYADYEMAQIILRAIDPDPARRWPDPIEMGKALIHYMQRNTVNDVPIGPELTVEPAAEEPPAAEAPAEEPAAEEAAELSEAAEAPSAESEPMPEPDPAPEAPAEEPAEQEPTAPEKPKLQGITDAAVIEATILAAIAADKAAAAAAANPEGDIPESEIEPADEPAAEEAAEPEEAPEVEEAAEPEEEPEVEETAEPEVEPEVEEAAKSEEEPEVEEAAEPEEEPEAEEAAESEEEPEVEEAAEPEEEPEVEEAAESEDEPEVEEAAEPEEVPEVEEAAESEDEPEVEETAESEEAPAAEKSPEEETGADWIDVLHGILPAEEADGADPDAPSLRDLLTDNDNSPSVEEADENAVLSDETTRILIQAQELIEHETPEPVVAPEPIEIPMPEPIVLEDPKEEEPESGAEAEPEAEVDEDEQLFRKITFSEEEPPKAPAAKEKAAVPAKKRFAGLGKKLAKTAVVLVIVAALAAGGYYYYENIYLQPIDSFTLTGQGNTITVEVSTTVDPGLLTVVRKDTYGNAQSAPLVDGKATFTDLKPGSQYIVSLEIEGFHDLVGAAPLTYSTPAQTQVLNLTAMTGTEDGSVLVNFAVEGPDIEDWTLTYSSPNTEVQSVDFTGHTVTVTGLTIGETYTLSLSARADSSVTGETSIDYTISDVILAQNVAVQGYADNSMTVRWDAPAGVTVPAWTARCYNEEGFDQVVQVEGNTATFTDISLSSGYTVEVIAQGMTQCARLFVTDNPILVSDMTASVSQDTVTLSWNYDGEIPEGGWNVVTTIDGSSNPQTFKTSENSLTVFPAVPGSRYEFALQTADGTSVFGGSASADLPAYDSDFSAYGLSRSNVHVFTYRRPSKESFTYRDLGLQDASRTFRPGSELALLLYTGATPEYSEDSVTTLVVFRDANGEVAGIDAGTGSWSSMWDNGYCVYPIGHLPSVPGTYTMQVYVGGGMLDSVEIEIAE